MTSKPLRRLSWILGSAFVSASVAEQAFLMHKNTFSEIEVKSLNAAQSMQMLNGIGLCLCASRKTRLVLLPMASLTAGTFLFSGIIFY